MSDSTLKVKTAALPSSRIAVEIEVTASRCKSSYEEALTQLSRSIKLPGFRKGKVPKAVIIQQIGIARIKASALESLLEKLWREAINQESIEPLCEPELKGGFETLLESFNPDKTLTFTLETDIAPTPILKKTKGLKAEAEPVKYDPAKIDELIEQSRNQLATIVPVETRSAEMGDIAVLSFKGTFTDDGSDIEGGNAESMDIELEEGLMIPGFVEGIVGMAINSEKQLKCTFPKDYPNEDARGRQASFQVTLQDLKTKELPKLDDAFAKQASDKENMGELREDLEKRLKEDAKARHQVNRKESLINALAHELDADLPTTLIDQEVRLLVEQTARKFAQEGMDVKSIFTPELVKSLMESSREEAQQNLRRKLALKALAKKENIEVNNEDLEIKLKDVNRELSGEKNIDQQKLRQAVLDDLLEEKLVAWLEENNIVTEKASKPSETASKEKPVNAKPSKETTKSGKTSKKKNEPKT